MANEYTSKVVLGTGEVLIDLTSDSVDAAHLLSGYSAHGADGAPVSGACTFDADTSSDTATADEILATKTAHARSTALTGTMTNNGAVSGTISTRDGTYTVPQGYHDGSGVCQIASAQRALIIPGNIKQGVTLLGITGDYGGEAVSVQSNKNATPSLSAAVEVTPDSGYDYLAKVTVAQISVTRTLNAAGGYTVTIG